MLKRLQIAFSFLAVVGLASGPVPLTAQDAPPPSEAPAQAPAESAPPSAPVLSPEQLDTLLAPIALYPDPLLAQILPAATEPGQVVAAHRYVKAKKDPEKIDAQPWDESVKALARYPDVLKMMDEKLDWTTELGEAFVAQPTDVFNSVQRLRAQAQSVGNLKTTPEQVVATDQNVITIMPANPQVIYVPQYSPQVVYVQQPVNVVAPLITFGAGLALGIWIHNSVNWHSGNVYYYNNGWNSHYHNGGWNNYHGGGNNINIDNSKNINIGNGSGNGSVWKPQNKPRPTPYGGGNGNNGNRPGGNGNGNFPNKPTTLPANTNKPGGGGLGGGQKPTTLPANKPAQRPNGGNMQKPANRPQQPQARPTPPINGGKGQFNREGSKPNQAAGNRGGGGQANRQAAANRAAGANRGAGRPQGGGGGGSLQRNN